jgi:hypothetical protein
MLLTDVLFDGFHHPHGMGHGPGGPDGFGDFGGPGRP